MQTPIFRRRIYRHIYRQIFALHARVADTAKSAKPFEINRLSFQTWIVDDVPVGIAEIH